jgi:hypothetical protein
MFYNRILRVWVVDTVDYFIVSFLIGSFAASNLKNYLSERQAMKRLKNSMIKKSTLLPESDTPILNSKRARIEKIYKLALKKHGGQLRNIRADHAFYNEIFKLSQEIKELIERLACFLKERELQGVARIFFRNGRLFLDLLLYQCRIDISYSLLIDEVSTQVIVTTFAVGGGLGFTLSWLSVGMSLVLPPVLISTFLIRSVTQQIINERNYVKFKKLVTEVLNDDELKETIRAFFTEGEGTKLSRIEMKPFDSDKNSLPEFNFDLQSDQTLEEFVKARMKEELGLVEKPSQEELEAIIQRKPVNRKPKHKGKTVHFRDFIDQIAEGRDDIIDAQIVQEPRRIPVKNDE